MKVIYTKDNTIKVMGGAVCSFIGSVSIEAFMRLDLRKKENRDDKNCIKELRCCLNMDVIIVHEELKSILTDEELCAVIAHEEGHIHYRHIEKTQAGEVETVNINSVEVINSISYELEADAYAVSKTSKEAMKNAFIKCLKFGCNNDETIYENCLKNEEVKQRLLALA